MAKAKKAKVKNYITLRQKKLAGGDYSLYLDIYKDGKRVYQFLKMYLHEETDEETAKQNENTKLAANAIKAQKIIELINEQAGISNVPSRSKMLVSGYMKIFRENCKTAHRGGSYANILASTYRRIFDYMGKNAATMRMKDLDLNFCRGFSSYLSNAVISTGKPLSKSSASVYFSAFNNMLQDAVIDEVIFVNPISKMRKTEKPKCTEKEKPFLSIEEVKALIRTDCKKEMVKRAFLFSCFTGLRISDVTALKWRDIFKDGNVLRYSITMQKTQKQFSGKLSDAALSCMPKREVKGCNDTVFYLPTVATIERTLRQWATDAGITKHVTFHTARHSYATMELAAGASLYTVSETLGHKSVQTAMVYAKVADKAKDNATDGVSRMFDKELGDE